jgi:hypothetical protein
MLSYFNLYRVQGRIWHRDSWLPLVKIAPDLHQRKLL